MPQSTSTRPDHGRADDRIAQLEQENAELRRTLRMIEAMTQAADDYSVR